MASITEIELKFIEIDKHDIISRIEALGAEKKYSHLLQSTVFSAEGYSVNASKDKMFLRVRQIGDEVFITHKHPSSSEEFDSREETEILSGSSYEQSIALISQLGFEPQSDHTKVRTHYELGNIHFEIDEYETIPAYLEIETQTEEDMRMICDKLGLDISQGQPFPIFDIYPEMRTF